MATSDEGDRESQDDELLALASIYDNSVFASFRQGDAPPSGYFIANLTLPQPFVVLHKTAEKKDYPVEHLPPVELHFELPVNYPSSVAPNFTLSAKWLTLEQLSNLCSHLDVIAEENKGEVVLFLWTSFLQEDALDYLGITPPLDLSGIVAPVRTVRRTAEGGARDVARDVAHDVNNQIDSVHCSDKISAVCDRLDSQDCDPVLDVSNHNRNPTILRTNEVVEITSSTHSTHSTHSTPVKYTEEKGDPEYEYDFRAVQDIANAELLLTVILDHNQTRKDFLFKTTLFTCQVCFLEKLGEVCLKFVGCGHVYCKECMKGYFELQIKEGSVSALTCPHDKCDTQAHPGQVRELVGPELFGRYDKLLLQCTLDTMSDVMYCPRAACGSAVMVDGDTNSGSCPQCQFVFCIFCKRVYHGVAPCKIQSNEIKKIRAEYERGSAEERRLLERRYGVRMIKGIIEDSYTADWLEENSKQCPTCLTHIQKIDGCNKMTCTKCRGYFCWLCGKLLSRANPYAHFNAADSRCFNQLFAGVAPAEGDDFEEEYEYWFQ